MNTAQYTNIRTRGGSFAKCVKCVRASDSVFIPERCKTDSPHKCVKSASEHPLDAFAKMTDRSTFRIAWTSIYFASFMTAPPAM
jgi:hypothetical protein